MYCTSCGSNLGTWTKKSCPRCGAPLRTSGTDTQSTTLGGLDSTPRPVSTPTPDKKRTRIYWLIGGLAAFAVFVGVVWWAMGPPPFDPPKKPPKVEVKPPVIVDDPPAVVMDPPVVVDDPPAVVMDPPMVVDDPPAVVMDPPVVADDPPAIVADPPAVVDDPPAIVDRPPAVVASTQKPPANTMSASRRSALREELSRCEDFRCNKRVQQKYCEGFWNRVAECRSAL